jgi:hypothetical protein
MAIVEKTIILTEKNDAGPLFDVFWSADCETYNLLTASISLPAVSSSALIYVDDTVSCIKLVSQGVCTNEVISGSFTPTTTTTTTAGPTTTTTTTIAPTTTTTTVAPTTTTTTAAPGIVTDQLAYNFNILSGSFKSDPGQFVELSITVSYDYVLEDLIGNEVQFGLVGITNFDKTSNAVYFNGTDEYGWLQSSKFVNAEGFSNTSLTLEAWINHESNQPNIYNINQSLTLNNPFGGNPYMDIGRDSNTTGSIEGTLYDGTEKDTIPPTPITQDIFYHYAHVYDTVANEHYLYVNGSLVGSGSASDTYTFSLSDMHIAEDYNSTPLSTDAQRRLQKIGMGNIRVYKKALSSTEINQNYLFESASYA